MVISSEMKHSHPKEEKKISDYKNKLSIQDPGT